MSHLRMAPADRANLLAKGAIFSKRDVQSLAQDVVAIAVQILSILFEPAHQPLIEFRFDALALVFRLFWHVRFHYPSCPTAWQAPCGHSPGLFSTRGRERPPRVPELATSGFWAEGRLA